MWARGTRTKAAQVLASSTFADMQIKRILPSHIQAWVKGMSSSLAPATVKVHYNLVHSAFRAAVVDKVLGSDPCVKVKLPRERRREARQGHPKPGTGSKRPGGGGGLVRALRLRWAPSGRGFGVPGARR